jgi:hypothetical protein
MMSITDHAMVQKTLTKLERHGVARTLHLVCPKAINRVGSLRILRGLHVETAGLAFLGRPLRCRYFAFSTPGCKALEFEVRLGKPPLTRGFTKRAGAPRPAAFLPAQNEARRMPA